MIAFLALFACLYTAISGFSTGNILAGIVGLIGTLAITVLRVLNGIEAAIKEEEENKRTRGSNDDG